VSSEFFGTECPPKQRRVNTENLARPEGRNQIRSTKSEILNKSELPKLKIQNKPQRLISTAVMAAGFQYQAEKTRS
jgi:hypothetical protein